MDIGAALSGLLIGLALAGYAYRVELTRLDYLLLGKLRAFLKPYRYKPRHKPKTEVKAEAVQYQGRHFYDETKPYSTHVRGVRVFRKPVHA